MSFRQDRTNPSTAVSNWHGRSETPKGWPSTRVSTWMNGGLFSSVGGSAIEVIQSSTATTAAVTFTSIPQTYKHLWFVWIIPGDSHNWGNFYSYALNNPVVTGGATSILNQVDDARALTNNGPQPTNYGLKMAVGDDSVSATSVQHHEFTWMYYADSPGSGTTSRWSSALGSGFAGNPTSQMSQYLTAWNENGSSTASLPITQLTVKFGDGVALPSGTVRTLYGIS